MPNKLISMTDGRRYNCKTTEEGRNNLIKTNSLFNKLKYACSRHIQGIVSPKPEILYNLHTVNFDYVVCWYLCITWICIIPLCPLCTSVYKHLLVFGTCVLCVRIYSGCFWVQLCLVTVNMEV